MNSKILEFLSARLKKDLPNVRVGDTVKVTVKIKEGTKERNQNYEGVVLKIKGSGINKTFTVRRVFQGVGVERVFFFHSPKIEKVTIIRSGKTRRAKLYYLRERIGKSTKLQEREKLAAQTEETLQKEVIPEEGKLVEVK
jgi:large subunit ribosomal protein L19